MKTKYKENSEDQEVKPKYPYLGKYTFKEEDEGEGFYIVLFTSPQKGMVVYSESDVKPIGETEVIEVIGERKIALWMEEEFVPLKKGEKVILKN